MAYRKSPAELARLSSAREHLVQQATDVVAEVGWAQTSVNAVAAAAGIAAGSVYQHFPSKAALAVEVFRRASGREVEVLGEVLSSPGDPVDRLVRGVEVFARRSLERRGLAYALLAAPAEPAVGAERLEFRRRYRALFAEVVSEGVAGGALPRQNPEVTAAALTGAVAEVLVDPLGAPGADSAEQLIGELTAMALRCLGATQDGED
ncbi:MULTISPECIES: TetR/AcrR family transcriptional regulator [Streptomyces]|uniref:Regulatory protein, TetR n=1 Tax=Streptomyces venezuelae (strain ATCC 10712 / CBS 650.69 / DSM 40230 / JCM 4526 / NBRC 13096 / PD 04745) TaxID=953739 RepID=F2R8C8_STRVP|nr:TetR/AcrR family transcriptional regulator [Streptomyces venezuelae]APE20012.1 TetR family transcriptional regulator [Streptomyces venezuelae]QER97413.1 TetR/AcrR family transcriptional regulator [Streptomyces venezuelae ATCC 10712]QES04611.1 TetR/AcrR family transcriptional regulator [Streptomyces venezuelae]CCA53846.1 regulatory protein, TetR [Streptomyces venezuelae ATCC 10712]